MNSDFWSIVESYPTIWGKIYTLLRWLICPFHLMEQYLPKKGTIIDIGCGEGVFCQYLARSGERRTVIGIDTNGKRIELAKRAGRFLGNLQFKKQNALSINFSQIDVIVMSDFFHHLNTISQKKLLKSIASGLKKGGVLLIKEISSGDLLRSRLSRFWDFVFYPKDTIYYREKNELKRTLGSLGFGVKVKKEALHFPGSTHLFLCTKQ